jgi:hypothetical protein
VPYASVGSLGSAKCTAAPRQRGDALARLAQGDRGVGRARLAAVAEILRRRRLELGHERLVVGTVGRVVVDAAHLGGNVRREDDGVRREQPPHADRRPELAVEPGGPDVAERDRRLVERPARN